ncbi:tRNA epoxyqueuosine(34) reductase QueG [Oecophyllibacter saccharovorans]|uniref:tRNA epoxyqueuosine(34) reductase QueG n=1 Tax=Oecophyllibacter saccharovorans TaxID=2558360 RepID=UPI001E46CF5A|nr:tRNA epoxyqueuosine(34) reductase QueG [Oecophyllibacter saccharovorans]
MMLCSALSGKLGELPEIAVPSPLHSLRCIVTEKKNTLESRILHQARALGFDTAGITAAVLPPEVEQGLRAFVAENRHGTMHWMEERITQRAQPAALWPEVQSVISLGLSYAPPSPDIAFTTLARPECGNISVYARNRDYHDVMKGMLKHLAQQVVKLGGEGTQVKVFVDTAPVAERDLAVAAGLGWRGKHGCVVSRRYGSWLFLGEIYTTLSLERLRAPLSPQPEQPGSSRPCRKSAPTTAPGRCGSCTRCLVSCPTDAFLEGGGMDARRCISYLTIEHEGPIPLELRPLMGNRIYGCDDCVAVCPWNRFAPPGQTAKLQSRPDREAPLLADLARLDDAGFRRMFSGSPVKRIGRNRFIRNVLIAIGNSGLPALRPEAERLCRDPDATVAECARWAAGRLRAV